MKQVAFINPNGEVQHVLSPGSDSDYVDGMMYGNQLAKDIPANMNPSAFIARIVWQDGQWAERDLQPSFNHIWVNNSWQLDTDRLLVAIRRQRDLLLAQSDHKMLPDVIMSDEEREAWLAYRAALRDLPDNIPDLENVVWPVPPS